MQAVGADEVLLDREQERLVLGELDEPALRRGVQITVERYLDDEARRTAGLRERRQPEEDLAGFLVLGDRLERFEVIEPKRTRTWPTAPLPRQIRRVFGLRA